VTIRRIVADSRLNDLTLAEKAAARFGLPVKLDLPAVRG